MVTYVLQSRPHMMNGDQPLQFDLWIIGEHDDEPLLEAVVDWQDGLLIFQAEGIEPFQWPEIAQQITLGMRDARKQIGDMWTSSEP